MVFIKRLLSAIMAMAILFSVIVASFPKVFAIEPETKYLKVWSVAEIAGEAEQAGGGIKVNADKTITFTAPVRGTYLILPANLGSSTNSLRSLSGAWQVDIFANNTSIYTTISVADKSEVAIPQSANIELNKNETIAIKLKAQTSGEILINYNIALIDEKPALIPSNNNFVVADELQVENVAAEIPAATGLLTVGFTEGTGLTGEDLAVGTKTAYFVASSGYTHYNGKSPSHENYNLRAIPTGYVNPGTDSVYYKEKAVVIHKKNLAMQGIIVTANQSGKYTLSSPNIFKDGTGAATLKVELPDGTIAYSITGEDTNGFSVTAELKAGQKMYLYADRGDGWNTANYYIYDLTLVRVPDVPRYEEDPDYEYVYEDHSDSENYADRLAAGAKYSVSGGYLTVKFPEKTKGNTTNYNWSVWVYENGAYEKLNKLDALTFKGKYSGTLANCQVYILCEDDNGSMLYNTYTEGGVEDLWIDNIIDPSQNYDYSFAIVGDTQMIVRYDVNSGDNKLSYIYDWLVDNAQGKNIEYVFGMGDITETREGPDTEWTHAKTEIEKLNGVIPYTLAQGNHDNHTAMNAYFGGNNYYAKNLDGVYTEGDITASYDTIDVGSEKFLMITLHWGPTDEELEWAAGLIKANPDRKVIITTHSFLETDGTTQGPADTVPATNSGANNGGPNNGDRIWDKLASQYENVFMVLSGHIASDNVIYRQEKGVHGNVVTSLLVNPQTFDQKNSFNTGMLCMLYFSNDGRDVRVEYISTCRDQYYGAANQYKLELTNHVFESWELTDTITTQKTLTYTADVNGIFNILQEDIAVNGTWEVTLSAAGKTLKTATVSSLNASLPDDKYIFLNKNEAIEITFKPVSNGASITPKYTVELIDEKAPKISDTGVFEEKISIADVLQQSNTAYEYSAKTGLITVGYSGVNGTTGAGLTVGQKYVRYESSIGATRYFGNYDTDAAYSITACPSDFVRPENNACAPNSLWFASKNSSVHGIIITADKAGIYTLSATGMLRDGLGAMNLIVEDSAGRILYQTSEAKPGLEVSTHLEVGEKLYLYAEKLNPANWNTAGFILYDFFLIRTCEGEHLIDDPNYVYKYEHHETGCARWEPVRKSNCYIHGIEMRRCSLCLEEVERRELALTDDHFFAYKLNPDNTAQIIETCDCGHNETATLELNPDVETVYNGSAIKALMVSYSEKWSGEILSDDVIDYTNHVRAGNASGSLTIQGLKITKKFTIAKKAATSPADPVASNSITYGAKLSTVGLSSGWRWVNTNIIPTVSNKGYTAYYVPNDTSNYDWTGIEGWSTERRRVERTVTVTVNKANLNATAPTANSLIYNKTAQNLVSAGSVGAGTLQYALGTNKTTAPTSDWSTDIPTATNAGTYYVWYKVLGDGNYNEIEPVCLEVTIAKAKIVKPLGDNRSFTYNGQYQTYIVNGHEAYIIDGNVRKIAGSNTVTVTITDTANYEWEDGTDEVVTFTFKIEKKELSLTWGNASFTYDATEKIPECLINGVVSGDDVQLSFSGAKVNANTQGQSYTATVTGLTGIDAANYMLPSNTSVQFTIAKGNQSAPSGLNGIAETASNKNDGKITGVSDAMEYRKEGISTYTEVGTASELKNLKAGKYFVRYKANNNYNASADTAVIVGAGGKLSVIVPQVQSGYTLTADKTSVDYNEEVTITYSLMIGYTETASFAVKVNGAPVTLVGGKYTVSAQTSLEIAVVGIADVTAPEGAKITVSSNDWTTFLNNITFGLFFKETQDVTISASDLGSGLDKVYYYISETALTKAEIEALANSEWTEYNGQNKPSIAPDKKCVIYVKTTDKAQNVGYTSSDGLVFDGTAPVISGIENNKTYYGDVVITVADALAGIKEVKVDGNTVALENGKYTIAADNTEHTVIAYDNAGNLAEYKVSVYKIYTIKFMDENGVYKTLTINHGETVTMPEPPKKDGYTVTWEKTIDVANGNETINAVYTPVIPSTGVENSLGLIMTILLMSGGCLIIFKRRTEKTKL